MACWEVQVLGVVWASTVSVYIRSPNSKMRIRKLRIVTPSTLIRDSEAAPNASLTLPKSVVPQHEDRFHKSGAFPVHLYKLQSGVEVGLI